MDLNYDKKKIRDVMTREVFTAQFDAPLLEALETMTLNDVSGVVVVNTDGEAMGVISSLDIAKILREKTKEQIHSLKAEDVMTPFVVEIGPEQDLEEAAKVMIEKKIHRLVIVSPTIAGRKPVGILSATDLVRELYKGLK